MILLKIQSFRSSVLYQAPPQFLFYPKEPSMKILITTDLFAIQTNGVVTSVKIY